MYNRYLSDNTEPYIPAREPAEQKESHSAPQNNAGNGAHPLASPAERIQQLLGLGGNQSSGTPLRRLLARFHLEDVDTGDLLLLILLFFLLEEKADDELLIALGILLIL